MKKLSLRAGGKPTGGGVHLAPNCLGPKGDLGSWKLGVSPITLNNISDEIKIYLMRKDILTFEVLVSAEVRVKRHNEATLRDIDRNHFRDCECYER